MSCNRRRDAASIIDAAHSSRARLRKGEDPDEHDDQDDDAAEHDLVMNLSLAAAHMIPGREKCSVYFAQVRDRENVIDAMLADI